MDGIKKLVGVFLLGLSIGIVVGTVRSGAGIRRARGDVAELRSDFGGIAQLAQQSDARSERVVAMGGELDAGLADIAERSERATRSTEELVRRADGAAESIQSIGRGVGEIAARHQRVVETFGRLQRAAETIRERYRTPR